MRKEIQEVLEGIKYMIEDALDRQRKGESWRVEITLGAVVFSVQKVEKLLSECHVIKECICYQEERD